MKRARGPGQGAGQHLEEGARALARLAVLAIGVVAASWALAGTASAFSSLQRVSASSAADSSARKGVNAQCPSGSRAISGGGFIRSTFGEIGIRAMTVGELGRGSGISAHEDQDGAADNWRLFADVMCVSAFEVREYEIVHAITPADSSAKTVSATCPSGTQVVGAGARIVADTPLFRELVLDAVRPSAGLTSVRAQAFEDRDGTGANWRLEASAVCAQPPPGLELVTERVEVAAGISGGVRPTCPSGKHALAAGADIRGGRGRVTLSAVQTAGFFPGISASAVEDQSRVAGSWSLTGYAICALP